MQTPARGSQPRNRASRTSLDLQFCSLTCKLMFYFYDLVFYFNFYWIGLNSFVKTNKKVIFIREILLISLNACKIRYFSIFFFKKQHLQFFIKVQVNTIYAERQIIHERSLERRDELNIYVFRRTKLARAANKMQGRRRAPYTTIKSIKERRGRYSIT